MRTEVSLILFNQEEIKSFKKNAAINAQFGYNYT